MKTFSSASFKKNISCGALSLALATGISLAAGAAFADDPTSMAPPVEASAPVGLNPGNQCKRGQRFQLAGNPGQSASSADPRRV